MAGKEGEVKSGLLEKYKKFNKVTLPIGVGVGIFGIFTGNPIFVAAGFTSAAIDAGQIITIDKVNKKPKAKEQVVFQAGAA